MTQDDYSLAKNAGQQWVEVQHAAGLVDIELLCPKKVGGRGYHARRACNFKIKIGKQKISMPQKPTEETVKRVFEEEWVGWDGWEGW